jgi:hypothetical protein
MERFRVMRDTRQQRIVSPPNPLPDSALCRKNGLPLRGRDRVVEEQGQVEMACHDAHSRDGLGCIQPPISAPGVALLHGLDAGPPSIPPSRCDVTLLSTGANSVRRAWRAMLADRGQSPSARIRVRAIGGHSRLAYS